MKKEYIPHEGAKAQFGPRAIKAGDRIYIASAAVDDDSNSVGATFEEQADFVFRDMQKTLESLGSSMDDILEMTMYLVDIEQNIVKMKPIFDKYFKIFPMVAAIGTHQLFPFDPPLLFETTATAIVPD